MGKADKTAPIAKISIPILIVLLPIECLIDFIIVTT